MAYGATRNLALTRSLGLATAREARALGVQWVFAPDADVNNNPDNPIINIRSFGENPNRRGSAMFARSSKALIPMPRIAYWSPSSIFRDTVTLTSTATWAFRVWGRTKQRMEPMEFVPFREAIADDTDSVMTAHMAVPAYETEDIPATVSKRPDRIATRRFEFSGLIVTDAMDMQGLAKQFSTEKPR